jgi:futalosine hydrolase
MRILVCAATEMEIAPLIQILSLKKDPSIHLLITGIGLMAATYALTKEIATHRPDAIIQAGVAGSLQPERSLAEVVAIKNECIGDIGVQQDGRFHSLFDLKLLSPHTLPWKNGKLTNESDLLSLAKLPVVDGVTVNEISTDREKIQYYRDSLQVQTESMEGAALHYVALLEKLPFLQIRSLSNYIGERDKALWRLEEAIKNLNVTLQQIFIKLEAL